MRMINNKKIRNLLGTSFLIKNRKGWLEIVEAFVAVLLVAGVLLIILNKGYFRGTDLSEQVYNIEISIIREIQTNDSLREDIAEAPGLPVEWEEADFPTNLREKIITRTPDYLKCVGKICELNTQCGLSGASLEESSGKDVYSESGVISAILGQEVYRQLNLFCWTK